MFKHTILVAAVVGLVFALAPPAHAGTILSGDLLIPTGLVEDDTFRLVFLTSTTTDATSTDIADYNTFVNTAANLSGSLVKDKGWNWYAIGSTQTVNANTNTGTDSVGNGFDVPIYRLDGTIVATGNADLWDGTIADPINRTELGTQLNSYTWTGTLSTGLGRNHLELGNTADYDRASPGDSQFTDSSWIHRASSNKKDLTNLYPTYALSEPLTIVPESAAIPEPATMCALGLAVAGLGGYIRKRRRA